MARQVRLEIPEAGRELGEGDPQGLHGPSLGPGGVRGRRRAPTSSRRMAPMACVPGPPSRIPRPPPPGAGRPVDCTCSFDPSTSSAKWQATSWPVDSSRSNGTSVAHRSGLPSRSRSQQRVWKWHPDGGFTGDGTSPRRMIRRRWRSTSGFGIGTADSRATVYGWSGSRLSSRDGASSTIRPRYITAIRSLMWRTTDRSWAMNR